MQHKENNNLLINYKHVWHCLNISCIWQIKVTVVFNKPIGLIPLWCQPTTDHNFSMVIYFMNKNKPRESRHYHWLLTNDGCFSPSNKHNVQRVRHMKFKASPYWPWHMPVLLPIKMKLDEHPCIYNDELWQTQRFPVKVGWYLVDATI